MDISLLVLQTKFLKRRDSSLLPTVSAEFLVSFDRVKSLLSLSPAERSPSQLHWLINMLKSLRYFDELYTNTGEYELIQCCRYMTIATVPAGQCVFREGDVAVGFYVILAGSCAVVTRKQPQGEEFMLETILRVGDSFGEIALAGEGKRTATVFCRETCHFAVLENEAFTDILKETEEREMAEKCDFLQRHPAFSSLPSSALQQVSNSLRRKSLSQSQSLFSPSKLATELYLVVDGSFRLTKSAPHSLLGPKKPLQPIQHIRLLSKGDIAGICAVLQATQYSATCSCLSFAGVVYTLDGKSLSRITAYDECLKRLVDSDACRELPQRKIRNVTRQSPSKFRLSYAGEAPTRPIHLPKALTRQSSQAQIELNWTQKHISRQHFSGQVGFSHLPQVARTNFSSQESIASDESPEETANRTICGLPQVERRLKSRTRMGALPGIDEK